MMPNAFGETAAESPPTKPFLIEIRQTRPRPNGNFIPASSLKINEALRNSGLLHSLDAEDAKNLLYLLTFLSPEGHCGVSLPILASAMRVPSGKVRSRMAHLVRTRWQGQPLILEVPHESGLCTYSLHPQMVAYEHLDLSPPHDRPPHPMRFATREQVIAHSRAHYARPRADVEREVARQMGRAIPEENQSLPAAEERETEPLPVSFPQSKPTHGENEQGNASLFRALRERLENAGLTSAQADETLQHYATDVIARQLDWLPHRRAHNPTGYLLSAIARDYEEPRGLRALRLQRENTPDMHGRKEDSLGKEDENTELSSADPIPTEEVPSVHNLDVLAVETQVGEVQGSETQTPDEQARS